MVKHTTPTGRALPNGRTTRRSKLVRTRSRGQERPLPLSLQCHPQALMPTSRNPQCLAADPVRAHYARMPDNRAYYLDGRGLGPEGFYSVHINGAEVGRTNTMEYGLAYTQRAKHCGLEAAFYI